MRNFSLAGVAAAAALAVATPLHAAAFDPLRFFDGRTEGEAQVKVIFKGSHGVRVHGQGHVEPDGTLVLVQNVEEEGKPPRQRTWHIRQTAPGRYTGTLSDADGPVTGDTSDGRFHIRYHSTEGYDVEQWLAPADPGIVHNSMTIRKFGVTIAKLEETIRKVK